jgi:hypothetical protein
VLRRFSFIRFLPVLDWISAAHFFLLVAIVRWVNCLGLPPTSAVSIPAPVEIFPSRHRSFWSSFWVLLVCLSCFSSCAQIWSPCRPYFSFFFCADPARAAVRSSGFLLVPQLSPPTGFSCGLLVLRVSVGVRLQGLIFCSGIPVRGRLLVSFDSPSFGHRSVIEARFSFRSVVQRSSTHRAPLSAPRPAWPRSVLGFCRHPKPRRVARSFVALRFWFSRGGGDAVGIDFSVSVLGSICVQEQCCLDHGLKN